MKICEVASINRNSIATDTEFSEYKYLDTGNITHNVIGEIQLFEDKNSLPSRARRLVNKGDIVISTVRPIQCHYGYMENADENLIVSTGFAVLTPNEELVDGKYLYYFLTQKRLTSYFQMIAECSVSSYPSITSDVIGNVDILLPSLSKQREIAESIYTLDRKIYNNRLLLENLEEYSQLLFYKWFVDFNFPDENGKPYKDSGGKMVEIDGKLIPKGWRMKSISHYISKTITGDWGTEEYEEGSSRVFCIRGADLPNWKFGKTNTTPIRYVKNSKLKEKEMVHGDVMIEISGGSPVQSTGRVLPIWKTALEKLEAPVVCSNFSQIIRPKNPSHGLFLGIHLQKLYDRGVFFHYESKTTGIKNLLLPRVLENIKIAVPPVEILSEFNNSVEPLYDKIHQAGYENQLLEELRDLMIKKLIK